MKAQQFPQAQFWILVQGIGCEFKYADSCRFAVEPVLRLGKTTVNCEIMVEKIAKFFGTKSQRIKIQRKIAK